MGKRKTWCPRTPGRVGALTGVFGMENVFAARTTLPNERVGMLSLSTFCSLPNASHGANANGKLVRLEQPPGEWWDGGGLLKGANGEKQHRG